MSLSNWQSFCVWNSLNPKVPIQPLVQEIRSVQNSNHCSLVIESLITTRTSRFSQKKKKKSKQTNLINPKYFMNLHDSIRRIDKYLLCSVWWYGILVKLPPKKPYFELIQVILFFNLPIQLPKYLYSEPLLRIQKKIK